MSHPSPPAPAPVFETREEVMFFDTDAGGVVHNIAYLRFIETCRTRLCARLGLDQRAMASTQQFAVVLRTEIDYKKPAVLGDTLIIRGRLDQLKGVRFWCAFEIIRASDDSRLVTCRQCLTLVQLPAGKPLRLPGDWLAQWPQLIACTPAAPRA